MDFTQKRLKTSQNGAVVFVFVGVIDELDFLPRPYLLQCRAQRLCRMQIVPDIHEEIGRDSLRASAQIEHRHRIGQREIQESQRLLCEREVLGLVCGQRVCR